MPFTVVFEGDVKDLDFNPLKYRTPYGKPIAIAAGDKLQEIELLNQIISEYGDDFAALSNKTAHETK